MSYVIESEKLPQARECIERLVQLKHDMGKAGMFRTMHKMEIAVKEAGWELADSLNAANKARAALSRAKG